MFKNLYTGLLTFHANFKTSRTINLFPFIKTSSIVKNYLNNLNFQASSFNKLRTSIIKTSKPVYNLDLIIPVINYTVVLWVVFEAVIISLC